MRIANVLAALFFGAASILANVGAVETAWARDAGPDVAAIAARLSRGGGGDWSRCVEISVKNRSTTNWNERPIAVPIAGTPDRPVDGALALVGERAESVRFCDATGAEFVFELADASGKSLVRGAVDEGATLTVPATVAAGETAKYFVFFRNDAAFPSLDRFDKAVKKPENLDFESGADGVPSAWRFDVGDEGRALAWSDDRPFSGKKCVRCDVAPDKEPSWIAARQAGIAVEPGAKYRFEGRVRGENVRGTAGWYLHLGNEENSMLTSPTFGVSDRSDFDWTLLSNEFVVPADANLLEFGTVLRGTGTAWFDAVSLVRLDEDANAGDSALDVGKAFDVPVPPSVYPSSEPGATRGAATFAPEKLGLGRDVRFALIRIDGASSDGERLVRLDLNAIGVRWGRVLKPGDFAIRDLRDREVPLHFFDDSVFFSVDVVQGARNDFVVVEKTAPGASDAAADRASAAPRRIANQAFPGTALQTTNAENAPQDDAETSRTDADSLVLPVFLRERNLLQDGDFESFDVATATPARGEGADRDAELWSRDATEPDVEFSVVDPGISTLGKKAFQMKIGPNAPLKWRGLRRRVALEPGRTYCVGFAISTDPGDGSFDLHWHQRRADGSLADGGMGLLGKSTGAGASWALKRGALRTSDDAAFVELHLTTQTRGTVRYDSLFVVPVDDATPIAFLGGKSGVFQVPSVAKVFRDSTFNAAAREVGADDPATCALALGEEETLQFAIRSEKDRVVRVVATAPVLDGASNSANGSAALETPEIFAVGNVVVDYPSSYYQTQGSPAARKFPTAAPSSDGWVGYWPDPLIPIRPTAANSATAAAGAPTPFDGDRSTRNDSEILAADGTAGLLRLNAGETRAVWLRFKTTPETAPGVYRGTLILADADADASTAPCVLPYSVETLAFQAPPTPIAAIYDARIARDDFGNGSRSEKMEKIAEKLRDRKLSSDSPAASPTFFYDKATGTATADWTEYDRVATRYFNELGATAAYFPGDFYFFGWGLPPKNVEGEAPYEGEYPYPDADRSKLRPEYKKAYQAKLKLFWEHLKEKGWADKCVLYISDEPFYSKPEIVAQMKALCDTIHEVDPKIPIYCSSWVFVPEWLGYLDVWGVGHYGGVGEAALRQIKDAGGRIWWTTDGQMCLDTPLCAVERLLPYSCVARGAEAYEFWGATWLTLDPFESASHLYISQSDQPGVRYYVRYPNGDGYIFYPGDLVGLKGEILDSIRSEQAREGVEDAGWLVGLRDAIAEKTAPNSPERADARAVLDRALNYLPLECGSGRFSTRYMSDPREFERIRLDVGRTLEALLSK